MTTLTATQDRIAARGVPSAVRSATELSGATVNQFLVQAGLKEAQAVIEHEDVIRLSPHDWNWLLSSDADPATGQP